MSEIEQFVTQLILSDFKKVLLVHIVHYVELIQAIQFEIVILHRIHCQLDELVIL